MTPHEQTAARLDLSPALARELEVCLDVALAHDGLTFYANSAEADDLRDRGLIVATQQEDADGLRGNIYRFTDAGRVAVRDLFAIDLAAAEPTPLPANVVRLADRRRSPACTCGGPQKGGA